MSISNSPLGPKPVRLDISAKDGASELFLVNGAYDQIGRAIGNLKLEVTPGQYHVRQRVGDTESIRQLDVIPSDSTFTLLLEPLSFPSAAPIIGSPNFREIPLKDWKKPEALIGEPGIRFVIRDPRVTMSDLPTKVELARLNAEKARLRLETMHGISVCELKGSEGTANLEESALFLLDVKADPGHYVLVQALDDGRQRCLPLVVHRDWSPRVYLVLQEPDAGGRGDTSPLLSLDNASIAYWPNSSGENPEQSDLIRLEAARKALARGRSIGGFLYSSEDGSTQHAVRDPMLALLDAYLILKDMLPAEIGQAKTAIDAAASSLGEDFPDVIALRYAFAESLVVKRAASEPAAQTVPQASFGGPPMLCNSWRHLLSANHANARLSELMPADFMPENSRIWFIWNEPKNARQMQYVARQTGSKEAGSGVSADDRFNLAVGVLVVLMQTDAVKDWVNSLVMQARERRDRSGDSNMDPLLTKLIDGLAVIQNPLLLEAFGARELARRVLLSFNLPSARLNDLLTLFSATLEKDGLLHGLVTRNLVALMDYLSSRLAGGLAEPQKPESKENKDDSPPS